MVSLKDDARELFFKLGVGRFWRNGQLHAKCMHQLEHRFELWLGPRGEWLVQAFPSNTRVRCNLGGASGLSDICDRSHEQICVTFFEGCIEVSGDDFLAAKCSDTSKREVLTLLMLAP